MACIICLCCAIRLSWLRQESVAGHEYARPNIGASITRANNGNGALPTRELEQGEKNETKSRHTVKRDG
jgi:hypothetical protein